MAFGARSLTLSFSHALTSTSIPPHLQTSTRKSHAPSPNSPFISASGVVTLCCRARPLARRHPRYAPPDDSESEEGRVYINEEQYFEGVEPAVWRFHVGGYQVCQKWLKDRKGHALDRFDDLRHYQNVVATLRRTMERMDTIDTLINEHGGWPLPGSTTADSDSEPSP